MSLNLIEAAKSLFTPEIVTKASSQLSEHESAITKAISGIVPAIFAALLQKVHSNEGANAVVKMVHDQQRSSKLADLSSLFSTTNSLLLSQGGDLLRSIFGNKSELASTLFANYAGVKPSTSNSILSLLVPAILGLIGKNASSSASNAITSLINGQRNNIQAGIPTGLNLGTIVSNFTDSAGRYGTGNASTAANKIKVIAKPKSGLLLPILFILAMGLVAYFLFG
jgi:hypothetical protein